MLNHRRRGVTLLEVIVAAGILAILGAFLMANPSIDSARIDRVARTLDELADACCFRAGTSFERRVKDYPSKLSQLSIEVTTTDLNICGSTFNLAEARRWSGPYYHRFIPPAGFKLAEGFMANDTLVRIPAVPPNPTAPGVLAIVIPGVDQADAQALALRVTGRADGQAGAVRFTLPPGSDAPVTVLYHINIRGC
jgi:prepilin-type N-terminal cleavage/methylation domain-containing protein